MGTKIDNTYTGLMQFKFQSKAISLGFSAGIKVQYITNVVRSDYTTFCIFLCGFATVYLTYFIKCF